MNGHVARWQRMGRAGLCLVTLLLGQSVLARGTAVSAGPGSGKINTYAKHGTIIFSDWQFPPTLNTFQSGLSATIMTMNLVLEGLDLYDNQARLRPDMLATLPSIKNHGILNGGRTIVLNLKP